MLVNFNGTFIDSREKILDHDSRLARYGDGIFESLVLFNEVAPLIHWHARRLAMGAEALEITLPEILKEENIAKEISRYAGACGLVNARLRIILYRDSDGFYTPTSNKGSYLMEAEALANDHYVWREEGLRMGVYSDILKPVNKLSNIKTCNALLYVKAGLYQNKAGFDECLVLNTEGLVCESISNNLFWIKDGIYFTPSPQSGCILGVFRNYLIEYLKEQQMEVREGEFSLTDIGNAEELFLTGATRGIRHVQELHLGHRVVHYAKTKTERLYRGINARLQNGGSPHY
jgi:branched-subunit amino acid aminotransferase/4-amino-4-deoxychorismate lyase